MFFFSIHITMSAHLKCILLHFKPKLRLTISAHLISGAFSVEINSNGSYQYDAIVSTSERCKISRTQTLQSQ